MGYLRAAKGRGFGRVSGGKANNRQRLGVWKKSSLAAEGTGFGDFSIKKNNSI